MKPGWILFAVGIGGLVALMTRSAKADQRSDGSGGDQAVPPPSVNPTVEGVRHVVRAGDSFSKIAAEFFGDWKVWPAIFDFRDNRNVVGGNPDMLTAGQTIFIPPSVDPLKYEAYKQRAEIHAWLWQGFVKTAYQSSPTLPPEVLLPS